MLSPTRELRATLPDVEQRTKPAMLLSSTPVSPPQPTLVEALEAAAHGGAPFLTLHLGREPAALDARAVLEGAWRYAKLLDAAGVAPGRAVAILLPTSAAFVEAFLGTMLACATPVPLASPMTFGSVDRYVDNLAAIVENAGVETIVTYGRIRDALATHRTLSTTVRHVITPEDAVHPTLGRMRSRSLSGSDLGLLQYTSGTTGRPKGVAISQRALVSNAYAIAEGLCISANDVGVSWLPMFHDMGLIGVLVAALCRPYPIHLLSPEMFVMRPQRWLKLISDVRGTLSPAPNFAYDLCVSRGGDAAGLNLESWRVALNGAEPVHVGTAGRFIDRYAPVGFRPASLAPVYGMAESTLAITFTPIDCGLRALPVDPAAVRDQHIARPPSGGLVQHAVSVGVPVAGAAIRVVRDDGAPAVEGDIGEVQTRGPSVMDGYYRNEDATREAFHGDWLRTGDLGFISDGELFIVGRRKEMIIKGGRNIYPYDVERIASETTGGPGAAAAFSRPNERTGTDDLVVAIECRETDAVRKGELEKSIRGEILATLGVKADDIILCPLGTLPRTTSGKVQRLRCRQLFSATGSVV